MKKKCRILAVEDDPLVTDLLEQIFTAEGFDFSAAATGEEMRQVLATHEVHVVVIDIVLPGGENGLDLAQKLAAENRPIILITGYHDFFEPVEQSGLRYLHKPFRIPKLLETVDAALRDSDADCRVKDYEYSRRRRRRRGANGGTKHGRYEGSPDLGR